MSSRVLLPAIFLSLLTQGCAFKKLNEVKSEQEATKPKVVNSEASSPTQTLVDSRAMAVTLQWDGPGVDEKPHRVTRLIAYTKEDPRAYYVQSPVTLSEFIPDGVNFEIKLPKLDGSVTKNIIVSAKARPSDINIKSTSLKVFPENTVITEESGMIALEFMISGVRSLLSDSEEQKVFITIDLQSTETGAKLGVISLTLSTPPKKIEFVQRTLAQFESEKSVFSTKDFNTFSSQSTHLYLLQVIDILNHGKDPVTMELPNRFYGNLFQKGASFNPQGNILANEEKLCVDSVSISDTTTNLASEFVLLPLEESTLGNWLEISNSGSLTIESTPEKKTLRIGLYAVSDEEFPKYYSEAIPENYYALKPLKTVTMRTSCDFGCSRPRRNPRFERQCDSIPRAQNEIRERCQNRVTTCLLCMTQDLSNTLTWGTDCNACYALELEQDRDFFKYDFQSACGEWEEKTLTTKSALKGTKVESIILDLKEQEINATARFTHSNSKDDPETRKIPFLNPVTIQVQ